MFFPSLSLVNFYDEDLILTLFYEYLELKISKRKKRHKEISRK